MLKKDQELLALFSNMNLGSFSINEDLVLNNVSLSFMPIHVPVEDYDHHISFDETTFIGMEEKDVKFVGNGSVSHSINGEIETFDFEGPVGTLKISFHLVDQLEENEYGIKSKEFQIKSFDFEVDSSKIEIKASGPKAHIFEAEHHGEPIRKWIAENLHKSVNDIKDQIFEEGRHETLQKIPGQNLLPAFGIFYAAYFSENTQLTNEYIDFGFSPSQFGLFSKKIFAQLKEIESEFEKPEKDNQDAIQIIIDENFFNSFVFQFTSVEKMYSLRELMSSDPRMALFKQLLTTTTIGMVLPSFKEEYGEGKMIDLVGTFSQSFFSDHIENA